MTLIKMTGNDKKKDLRVRKTYIALHQAMFSMLNRYNFNDITVNGLCTEALISRTAFYAHFRDKYDLLQYFLSEIQKELINENYEYKELEVNINCFISFNKKVITNILKNADRETLSIVSNFLALIIEPAIQRELVNTSHPNCIILVNFITGGLIALLTWLVDHDFPEEFELMNDYLYKMLESMILWDAEQE